MGIWDRILLLLRIRGTRMLDQAEDPQETLDYAIRRQLELQQQMRRGVADMVTSRKRLELQARQLEGSVARLEGQARTALQQQREDLAREALARRAMLRHELGVLREQEAELSREEARLIEASKRLDLQVQRFRAQAEAAKAAYRAARARAGVGESLAGLGADDTELLLAVRRAEDRIADTRARADALEGLLASGALENPATAPDAIQRELDMTSTEFEVAIELKRLKGKALPEQNP